jgi:exportin-2 (importin alpha re-exporter)
MNINFGVLETARSIFRAWRSRVCSDVFWSVIRLVHSQFLVPYFQLLGLTIEPLLATPDLLVAQTMAVLTNLYHDLSCQDLVPKFEDRHETFYVEGTGYFMQLTA